MYKENQQLERQKRQSFTSLSHWTHLMCSLLNLDGKLFILSNLAADHQQGLTSSNFFVPRCHKRKVTPTLLINFNI